MTKKFNGKGYTNDMTLSWIIRELGDDWLQWQQYAAEWLAAENSGIGKKLEGISMPKTSYSCLKVTLVATSFQVRSLMPTSLKKAAARTTLSTLPM